MANDGSVAYGRKERYVRSGMAGNPLSGVWGSKTVNWKSKARRKAMRENEGLKHKLRSKADTKKTLGTSLNKGIRQMRNENKRWEEYNLSGKAKSKRPEYTAEMSAKRDMDTVDRRAGGAVRPDEQLIRPVEMFSPEEAKKAWGNRADFSKYWDKKLGVTKRDKQAWRGMQEGVGASSADRNTRYLVSDRKEHRKMARGLAGSTVRSITQGYVPGERRRWITGSPAGQRYRANATQTGRRRLWRRYGVY